MFVVADGTEIEDKLVLSLGFVPVEETVGCFLYTSDLN